MLYTTGAFWSKLLVKCSWWKLLAIALWLLAFLLSCHLILHIPSAPFSIRTHNKNSGDSYILSAIPRVTSMMSACKPWSVWKSLKFYWRLWVLRWLASPIRDRHDLPQWGQMLLESVTGRCVTEHKSLFYLNNRLCSRFWRCCCSKIAVLWCTTVLQLFLSKAWFSQVCSRMKHCLSLSCRMSLYLFLWPPCERFPVFSSE